MPRPSRTPLSTSRLTRRLLPALLLALSLTGTGIAAADSPDTPPRSAATQPSGATTVTGERPALRAPRTPPLQADRSNPTNPTGTATKTRPFTPTSKEQCAPTRVGSREFRAGAVEACVTTSTTPPAAAAAAATDSGSCSTVAGQWRFSRFGYCLFGLTVLYTLKDANGTPVGTGTLSVTTSAALSADKTGWQEQVRVTMTHATDLVTTLNVKFRHACTAGCTAVTGLPWSGKKGDLVPGQTVSGTVSYTSAPADGERVDFNTSSRLYVIAPNTTPTDPHASWQNPEKVRCDADPGTPDLGTPKSGCVVAGSMPVIKMSALRNTPDSPTPSAGAAAASYLWAQDNLADGWGRNTPLTRATANSQARTDRTCGNAGSKPFEAWTDLAADDSCAEFPFAVTSEGGTDGAECAEVVPNYVSGGWRTYQVAGGAASPCVRAHVPSADLKAAEQQVLAEYASQRVLEGDKFQVEITTSTAQPQAACLKSEPRGIVLPSGNGWIKNTTEPVPNVNKTTTPLGPPGDRPAAAQACLGKPLDDGSEAGGDITGWQDAQLTAGGTPTQTGLARCHLIAKVLGGKGKRTDGGPANLVPCWQKGMNTGTPSMRSYEDIAHKAILDDHLIGPNDAVFYEVTPMYRQSDSTIPHGVTMKARIERADGTQDPLFPDVYIPNTKGNTGLRNLGN